MGHVYPGAWKEFDRFRASRGQDGLPDWPEWCYAPLAAAHAIVSAQLGVARLTTVPELRDMAVLGALAAWRVTQGIYRYDETLYRALVETPVTGRLPNELLYRLPEWCVYIETPIGLDLSGNPIRGAFAHLEWDANTAREELRFVLDADLGGEPKLSPLVIHLGEWTLDEAIARSLGLAEHRGRTRGMSVPLEVSRAYESLLPGLVSLLLYLCSEEPDIIDWPPPQPRPKRTKRGWRLFPADKPTTWEVGVRLGAALRRAERHEEPREEPATARTHARPRPHIRRAHWHGFWTGPRSDPERRQLKLRWLPPIPVAVDDLDALPATVRPVT